uniref:Tc1-like transposase DDE domain-containing protein n=1 Tax=Daphnia galeata TaxID=27404 RepID=A0A8J2WGG3_9CRUS|nr:unnamed protein product [Daphnia galeata]
MKKETYHKILIRKAVPGGLNLLGEGFIFQEDNDPKPSSNLCRSYLDKKEKLGVLKRMIWPPQSPDLNPIEQVCDFVNSRLEESNKVTSRTIWAELEKAWRQFQIKLTDPPPTSTTVGKKCPRHLWWQNAAQKMEAVQPGPEGTAWMVDPKRDLLLEAKGDSSRQKSGGRRIHSGMCNGIVETARRLTVVNLENRRKFHSLGDSSRLKSGDRRIRGGLFDGMELQYMALGYYFLLK